MATANASKFAARPNDAGLPLARWLLPALSSTVGSKFLVALTGLALTGFVIVHMSGNLLIFKGRDALNSYALFLKDRGALLWLARGGLLFAFVLHLALALRLHFRNRAARPAAYACQKTIQASWASRHMALTGVVILAFVIFHLLHYTFGVVVATTPDGVNYLDLHESFKSATPADPAKGRHDVYAMTVYGFRNVPVSLAYIVAQVFLFLHLSHGVASTFQSLGCSSPRVWPTLRKIGLTVAFIVVAGNIAMPLGVMTGLIGRDVPGEPPVALFK